MGTLKGDWVPHDTRDAVVDFVRYWSARTGLSEARLFRWLGLSPGKFYDWKKRCGKGKEDNAWVPRDQT